MEIPTADVAVAMQPRLFTADEYYRMACFSIFRKEERVELIFPKI